MSESAPESGGGGGGNVFTRKLGPLPMWGWMGIAALIAVLYYLFKKNQAANSAAAPATNNTPGGVDSSLVPQFVNQVYNQETPPPAPNVTVNNTTTPPPVTPPPDNDHDHDHDHDHGGGGGGGGGGDSPPPPAKGPGPVSHPAPKPKPPAPKVSYKKITVQPGQTLQSLAAQYHTTTEAIAHAPGNVYVKGEVPGDKKVGQQLGTGAGLKTGMTLNIPVSG